MVQTFKILKGIDNVTHSKLFKLATHGKTRGHDMKLFKQHCRLDIRKYSFSQRVVNTWNSLPQKVISSETVNEFKSGLEEHWKSSPSKYNFI